MKLYTFLPMLISLLSVVNTTLAKEKLKIGRYDSRAIWSSTKENALAPTIILLPGSGAFGPEEMIPASMTLTNKDEPLFNSLRIVLNNGGVNTLALGKPGVEFVDPKHSNNQFYNKDLFKNLRWQDLLNNIEDAISYLETQKKTKNTKIYLLGHSEGTKLAIDYTLSHADQIEGVILLGYSAENLKKTIEWQLIDRTLDSWLKPDVDVNHDGFITKNEARYWENYLNEIFPFWKTVTNENEQIPYKVFKESLENNPIIAKELEKFENYPLWSDGVYSGEDYYSKVVALSQDVWIYSGKLDLQTRTKESIKQKKICDEYKKKNCYLTLVKNVGHGFSSPRPPRKHPLLDITVGPFNEEFLEMMRSLAQKLAIKEETNSYRSLESKLRVP